MQATCTVPEKKRNIINGDKLCRQYYNNLGEVNHLQVLLFGEVLKVLPQSIHGTAGNYPGVSEMLRKIRQKHYFPSISTYFRIWDHEREMCIQDKRIRNTRIIPELIHIPEFDLGPEKLIQIHLLPELPPSGAYENIIGANDVVSRHAFAYPVFNPTAEVIIDIITRHAFLPTLKITDKGSVFASQIIYEVTETLDIKMKHATTKHAQTIGVLERANATNKTPLKKASGEYRNKWHK